MTDKTVPTWGYRAGKDGVESKLFDTAKLPKGWKDSPAGLDKET